MASRKQENLLLEQRSRCKDQENLQTVHWNPRQTAIIICDMWDDHTCKAAAQRVAEMVPTMNRMVSAAREIGVSIIHAPSGTMSFYDETSQRRRAIEASFTESLWKSSGTIGILNVKENRYLSYGTAGAAVVNHAPAGLPTTKGLDSGRAGRCLGPGRSRSSKLPPKMSSAMTVRRSIT